MLISKEDLANLRTEYPEGTKVKLISMKGEPQMPAGLTGTISFVDGIGQIQMDWDNGSSLALIRGKDKFEKC